LAVSKHFATKGRNWARRRCELLIFSVPMLGCLATLRMACGYLSSLDGLGIGERRGDVHDARAERFDDVEVSAAAL
jgi:hypothetical protein